MFTGIVQHTGRLMEVERGSAAGHLVLLSSWDKKPAIGESIAVQGVCLTLTRSEGDVLAFDVLEETFSRTNLGAKKPGDILNLEPALTYGDPMGGHIVNGHVDGVGAVQNVLEPQSGDRVLEIGCDPVLAEDIVTKGSIAVDGVSLTVVTVLDAGFTVHIIPHTWEQTSLGGLKPGHSANLETDVLAKYVRALMRSGGSGAPLSWDILSRFRTEQRRAPNSAGSG